MLGGGRDRTGLLLAGAGSRDTEEVVPAAVGSGARDPKARIIHSRDAAKDTVDLMTEAHAEEIGGVNSLLFLYEGDGEDFSGYGILLWNRRRADF